MFGCVTITINTPLLAYQLLDHSNGLSPSIVSLWALFLLVYNYISSLVPCPKEQLGHLDYSSYPLPLFLFFLVLLFSLIHIYSFITSSFCLFVLLPSILLLLYNNKIAKHESDVGRGLYMYLLVFTIYRLRKLFLRYGKDSQKRTFCSNFMQVSSIFFFNM